MLTVLPFALLKHQLSSTPFATSKASYGNSVMPENTGSGNARGKRPGWKSIHPGAEKQQFSHKENCCFSFVPRLFFFPIEVL